MIRSTLAALAAVMTLSVAAAQQPAASAAAQAQQGPGELIEEKAQLYEIGRASCRERV